MAPCEIPPSSRYAFSSAERRASLRYRSNVRVICRSMTPDLTQGKDVSTNGIGVVCNQELAPGMVLDCQFLNPTTRFICSRPVQVMRVEPHSNDQWLAGCRFAEELGFSELLGLL